MDRIREYKHKNTSLQTLKEKYGGTEAAWLRLINTIPCNVFSHVPSGTRNQYRNDFLLSSEMSDKVYKSLVAKAKAYLVGHAGNPDEVQKRIKHRLLIHYGALRNWKARIQAVLTVISKMRVGIREINEDPTKLALLSDIRGEVHAVLVDSESIEVRVKTRPVICKGRTDKLIGSASYRVKLRWCPDSLSFLYNRVHCEAMTVYPITPHVGNSGNVCLGSYDYSIAITANKADIFQLLYTLLEFNRTADRQDAWGMRIVRNPTVVYTAKGREPYIRKPIDWPVLDEVGDMRDVAKHHYLTGKTIKPHDDYVKCAVTRAIIKRDTAIRLPIYVSENVIEWGREIPYHIHTLYSSNKTDAERLKKAKHHLISKNYKAHVDECHQSALRTEARNKYLAGRKAASWS